MENIHKINFLEDADMIIKSDKTKPLKTMADLQKYIPTLKRAMVDLYKYIHSINIKKYLSVRY